MSKDAYYFSHDSNARHDPKIIPMRGVYGAAGYGWYWVLIEMMRDANGYKLDMQGKYIWNAYAQQMGCTNHGDAKHFIMDCIDEFKLFASDGNFFWSNSLIRRMEKREEVAGKRKKAAMTRWGKSSQIDRSENADKMQMHEEGNASAMQGKESKSNESKGNETKGNNKPSRQKRMYAEDSSPYLMALYLHNKIMAHAVDSGVAHLLAKSNLQSWADNCRKLLEIDKIDRALIRDVIDWATSHKFWKKNILSAATLRDQFAKLAIEMMEDKKGGDRKNGRPSEGDVRNDIPIEQQSLTSRFTRS